MCHSVEMYLPQITRHAAEQHIGRADFAAAERERGTFEPGLVLWAWLKALFNSGDKGLMRERMIDG